MPIRIWDGTTWLDARLPGVPRIGDLVSWFYGNGRLAELEVYEVIWTPNVEYVEVRARPR